MKPDVISHRQFNKTKDNLQKILNVDEVQPYFPILYNYNFTNMGINCIFKSRYLFNKLLNEVFITNDSIYTKIVYEASIYDRKKKIYYYDNVFIKSIPILDPIGVSIDIYSLTNNNLSNLTYKNSQKQINNYNNEAYIDAFFTYIGSYMGDNNIAPTFPRFFGTYSCITKKFRYDITEEISDIKHYTQFKKNYNKKFILENLSQTYTESASSSLNNIRSHTSTNSIGSHNSFEYYEDADDTNSENSDIIDMFSVDKLELGNLESDLQNIETTSFLLYDNFPTQLIIIEQLDITLDDYLEHNVLSDDEWLSILFQICYGLAISQKLFKFVHNDLHSSNIMFKQTTDEYIYYKILGKLYKVPTFGRIIKIIDFGRATFSHNKFIYFSSAFDINGDAEGQYDYPKHNSFKYCKRKPNYSFDLARLATTIIKSFSTDSELYRLLKTWMTDKYNKFILTHHDDFNLYIKIANDMNNAIPIKQFKNKIFNKFIVKQIVTNDIIYTYN